MSKVRQPSPIYEGWEAYRKLVDQEIKQQELKKKGKNHLMSVFPNIKCLTHKDCHLDSFYPGKHWRKMKQREDGSWYKEK